MFQVLPRGAVRHRVLDRRVHTSLRDQRGEGKWDRFYRFIAPIAWGAAIR